MVGIVFIGNLIYCPYIEKYKRVLEDNNVEYETLFWNRDGLENKYPSNFISYNKKSVLKKKKIKKIRDFLLFGAWLKKQIKKRKYEKLIVLDTLSGILVKSILINDFKGEYIYDIRDYSYEGIKPFYKIEKQLIVNSNFTCISSKGFENFLPQDYKYTLVHNFNYNDLRFKKKFVKKEKGSTLNIVWNGTIRYFEHQSSILKKLQNDKRFNIYYHGIGPEYDMFKQFCLNNNINNVYFSGEYSNSDKAKLLADADIINNSYGTKKENEILYAVSNKYYDGLIYGIPQLVEVNTYKCRKVENLSIGIGLNVSDREFANILYEYYFDIDEKDFNISCEKELSEILKEDKEYLNRIKNFIVN